jgi:hypothetical protein
MLTILRNAPLKAFLAFVVIALSSVHLSAPASASTPGFGNHQAAEETDAIAVNPATNGAADKSRTRFDYQLNPSQPARDSIYVVNTGTSSQDVTLYARDAFAGAKGDFLIQDQSVEPTDVGSWVRFDGNKKVILSPSNREDSSRCHSICLPRVTQPPVTTLAQSWPQRSPKAQPSTSCAELPFVYTLGCLGN